MFPKTDISKKKTVTDTVFPSIPTYRFRTENPFVLEEISFMGDSNFTANGHLQIQIGDNFVTSENNTETEIEIIDSFTLRYTLEAPIVLPRGSVIVINQRVDSGSAVTQSIVTGRYMTDEEYNSFLAGNLKFNGGV